MTSFLCFVLVGWVKSIKQTVLGEIDDRQCLCHGEFDIFLPKRSYNAKVRDYSNFNTNKFMADLCKVDWNNICHSADVNKSFSRFYKNINRLINKHAPLKELSRRRLKLLAKPWLTKGLRRSIRVKIIYSLIQTGININSIEIS